MTDAPPAQDPESLEVLQSRHRKEQRDLVARITQKKKSANKKTRKGVLEECERLERELKERQDGEVSALSGENTQDAPESEDDSEDDADDASTGVANLSLNGSTTPTNPSSTTPSTAPSITSTESKSKKPNRAKARLARRAATQASLIAAAEHEAAQAPNPRELERAAMATQIARHNLKLHEIRADGHCLYAAVADQLGTREVGVTPRIEAGEGMVGYKKVRHVAAGYIEKHAGDFEGFMEEPLQEHVRKVRETGEWGGHLELEALSKAYGVQICVLHSDGRVDRVGEGKEEVWLGYFKHSHGLGEHYNSLRKEE